MSKRRSPIDMTPDEFRRAGHRLVDDVAALLETMPAGPVNRDETPSRLRELLPSGLPEEGANAGALLDETVPLLRDHSLYNGHPRFFGYITAPAAPIGILADMLAAAINPNVGGWQLSPIASEIEGQCVRWIAQLLGRAERGGGMLVSGGNVANFCGFLAARRAKARANIRADGVAAEPGRLRLYASTEVHTWIQKAADLFGLGTGSIRWIAVDDAHRMDLDALNRQLDADAAAGDRPFLLVGTAGTVSTGAVDPLREMAALARERGLWFHVDGAYGAFATLVPELAARFEGLAEADSVAVDPHKWLYAPLEAGCVLVRDASALRDAFGYTPPYYRFTGEDSDPRTNYYEYGFQNSRGFRALKVWLALRQAGRAGYARMIADDIMLTRTLHDRVAAEDELEPWTCELSISTFRYVPSDLRDRRSELGVAEYLDRLNEELLRRMKAGGEAFLSNAVIDGRFLLRACIVNFRTSTEDVEALPAIVVRYGAETDRALRESQRS